MRRARRWIPLLAVAVVGGCFQPSGGPEDGGWDGSLDAGPSPDAAASDGSANPCSADGRGLRGSGRHRLFVQGHSADPLADGTWPLLHEAQPDGSDAELCDDSVFVNDTNGDGIWQPGEEPKPLGPSTIVHGEHFLVSTGSFVEFTIPLCDDITGEVSFYIPNFDEEGSEAIHQLFVVHEGEETLIAEAIDDEPGFSGYNPFIRQLQGIDPEVTPGDTLLLRSTNLSGYAFSVMVWYPPSEYESWILVEVP